MREIKFRLVDDQNNIIQNITGFECLEDGKIDGVFVDGDYYDLEENKLKLLQFTGLYDKNNTPIYEGDIVMYDYEWTKPTETGVITWNKENASFQIKGHIPSSSMKHLNEMKVVGNIYDNEVEEC